MVKGEKLVFGMLISKYYEIDNVGCSLIYLLCETPNPGGSLTTRQPTENL